MSDVTTWTPEAAGNNTAAPDGFPENMPPSGLNDASREVMAAVRRAFESTGLINSGGTNFFSFGTHVEKHGATGDGVTDDYAAIQAAIDEVEASGGGTVYFSEDKTYICSAGLIVTNQSVGMVCLSNTSRTCILRFSNDVDGVTVNQAYFTMIGIRVRSTADPTVSTKNGVLLAANSKYHRIEDVFLENWSKGLHAQDTVMSVWDKVICRGCRTSFKIDTTCTSLTARSCWANANDLAGTAQVANSIGFDIDNMNYSTFINCGADACASQSWIIKGGGNNSLISCASEGTSNGSPDQSLLITNGAKFLSVKNFKCFRTGNTSQGAFIRVLDGSGSTKNIIIDNVECRNPNATGEDDFEVNCTGPVWIKSAIRDISDVRTDPSFTNAVGLVEYHCDYVTSFNSDGGSVTIDAANDTVNVYRSGHLVKVSGFVSISSVSSPTGQISIQLPFTSTNDQKHRAAGNLVYRNVDYSTTDAVGCVVLENSADLDLKTLDSASDWGNITPAASDQYYFSIEYHTSAGYTMPSGMDATSVTLNE